MTGAGPRCPADARAAPDQSRRNTGNRPRLVEQGRGQVAGEQPRLTVSRRSSNVPIRPLGPDSRTAAARTPRAPADQAAPQQEDVMNMGAVYGADGSRSRGSADRNREKIEQHDAQTHSIRPGLATPGRGPESADRVKGEHESRTRLPVVLSPYEGRRWTTPGDAAGNPRKTPKRASSTTRILSEITCLPTRRTRRRSTGSRTRGRRPGRTAVQHIDAVISATSQTPFSGMPQSSARGRIGRTGRQARVHQKWLGPRTHQHGPRSELQAWSAAILADVVQARVRAAAERHREQQHQLIAAPAGERRQCQERKTPIFSSSFRR